MKSEVVFGLSYYGVIFTSFGMGVVLSRAININDGFFWMGFGVSLVILAGIINNYKIKEKKNENPNTKTKKLI